MKRGDLVTVAMPGDFGKPRPVLSPPFGTLDDAAMVAVNRSLALFLGFA